MKIRKSLLMIMVLGILINAGCGDKKVTDEASQVESQTESSVSDITGSMIKELTAKEADERINSGDPVVILDVRGAEEYKESHIPGAILAPEVEITNEKPTLLPVMDAEILIYGSNSNNSRQAAQKLIDMGYTNINVFGGITDWSYDTVSGAWEEKEGTFNSFSAVDLYGKYLDETFFANKKLTMINVWATFCGPCLREMPDLGELSENYASQDVQVAGIVLDTLDSNGNVDQSQVEYARTIVDKTKASYTHLLPSIDLLRAGVAGIYSVPTTFFVDRNGSIVGETYVGSRGKEEWSTIINNVLAGMEE